MKSNTNYIFTFGNTEVGKSSFLASLCDFVNKSPDVLLRKNVKNKNGHRFLRENWLDMFRRNRFPPRSLRGEIYEIDIGIQELVEDIVLPITFLEMSGEDLMIFDSLHADERLASLKNKFVNYISNSKILFLVTSPQTCSEDDYTFDELFESLDQQHLKFPIGVIITKIDTVLKQEIDMESFVRSNMPATYKWILKQSESLPTQTFFYSTGVPDSLDPSLFKIGQKNHHKYADDVLEWICEILD